MLILLLIALQVLFLNDVVFTADDVLELLHTRDGQYAVRIFKTPTQESKPKTLCLSFILLCQSERCACRSTYLQSNKIVDLSFWDPNLLSRCSPNP